MHADAQWCLLGTKEKLGDFQFHRGGRDCIFSSVVGPRKQNRHQKRNIAYGKKKKIHRTEKDEIGGMEFCF